MSMLVLVDTNILIYAFDPSKGEKRQAALAIMGELLEQDGICLSTQSFRNCIRF